MAPEIQPAPVRCHDSRQPERSEEHTSELQSQSNLVCRLLLEKKKKNVELQQISRDLGLYRNAQLDRLVEHFILRGMYDIADEIDGSMCIDSRGQVVLARGAR